ncbi:helix-turn-helix transcriptional regulator [Streptomyces amakusaensis]|uniref:helix-turn-helix transcriptional regulator n=1 Tax=Streptomyces amakusaensis TaxID=67271 RepID=UPI0031D3B856
MPTTVRHKGARKRSGCKGVIEKCGKVSEMLLGGSDPAVLPERPRLLGVQGSETSGTSDIESAIEGARLLLLDALITSRRERFMSTTPVEASQFPLLLSQLMRSGPEQALPVQVICGSLDGLAQQMGADPVELLCREVLDRGHRLMILHHDLAALRIPDLQRLAVLAGAGADVRLLPRSLPTVTVVGTESALLHTSLDCPEQALLIRSPETVRALQRMHDGLRDLAVDFRLVRQAVPVLLRPSPLAEVLEKLCAGMKDESAARQMRVSVRTYRRYVANILKTLDVTSRFEAGMRVSQLGLTDLGRRLSPVSELVQ